MKQLYALGDEVIVNFIGTVKEISLKEGEIVYGIRGNLGGAFWMKESQLCPVELPKEEKQ